MNSPHLHFQTIMAQSNYYYKLAILTISIFLISFSSTHASRSPNEKQDFESLLSMPKAILNHLNGIDDILPKFVGRASYSETPKWKASCFKDSEARLEFHQQDGSEYGGGTLRLKVSHPEDWTCTDIYIFATPFSFRVDYFFSHGEHTIEFKKWHGKEEYEYVRDRGVSIFLMHSGMVDTLHALKEVGTLFENSDEGENANIEFLKNHMGAKLEERPGPWVADINVNDIKSGDFIALSKIRGPSGGFETLEKWVTGSYAGHSAVCLRNPEGKLFVAESGRANDKGEDVIDVVPWEEWWEFERTKDDANPHIALLPLHPEIRGRFNETAAWEFANSLKGNPYGYHNVIFSWIDTLDRNYPSPMDANLVASSMTIWYEVNHKLVSNLWEEALNKRLGTRGKKIPEILVEIDQRGLFFAQVLAIPELDSWEYSSGKSVSCVAFVMQIYKASGIFHPITDSIQGNEFTVKDGYQLKIYENNPSRVPKWCNNENDEAFCQILGKYRMELPGYNTIEPYPHMNENCPTMPPSYDRPKFC